MKIKKCISLGGNSCKIIGDPGSSEARFITYDKDGTGTIVVGTERSSPDYVVRNFAHEIAEFILTKDLKRYKESEGQVVFVFDHIYFVDFIEKFISSLVEIGIVSIPKKIYFEAKVPGFVDIDKKMRKKSQNDI